MTQVERAKHPVSSDECAKQPRPPRVCRGNSYTVGNWVWQPRIDPAQVYGERWLDDAESNAFRDERDFRRAHPEAYDAADRARADWLPNPFRAALHWQWTPDARDCELLPFDRESFCRALNGRSILIVGDSINLEFAMSLSGLAGGSDLPNNNANLISLCTGSEAPLNRSRLLFVRNDHLSLAKQANVPNGVPCTPCLKPWTPIIERDPHAYEILIVNSGAHYRLPDDYKQDMQSAADWLREHYPGRIIYRTTFG